MSATAESANSSAAKKIRSARNGAMIFTFVGSMSIIFALASVSILTGIASSKIDAGVNTFTVLVFAAVSVVSLLFRTSFLMNHAELVAKRR